MGDVTAVDQTENMWNGEFWLISVLLWMWIQEAGCVTQVNQPEEVDIFNSETQAVQGWKSEPRERDWDVVPLTFGAEGSVRVVQACTDSGKRTFLSPWMERRDAHNLLLDITFGQEEELSGQPRPLQVYLFDSDTPTTRFQRTLKVLDLQTPTFFPVTHTSQLSGYFDSSRALDLGAVTRTGFQLGFSYTSSCVLVKSIRLYYRRCPDMVADLTSFTGTGAGSEPVTGSCVRGAVEVSPPVRECGVEGVWGPLQGECVCEPGHEPMTHTCQACRMGFYKPANQSGGCVTCPPNSRTHREASEECDCVPGYSRLPTEPHHLGCTKPPSAPVNLTAHHHNDSVLLLTWDPPHDLGGRQEVTYHVKCEKHAQTGGQWEECEDDVDFLSDLDRTSVRVSGVNPQHDYRLSVQATNDVSTLKGASAASTATVTIHRWRVVPPAVTVQPVSQTGSPTETPDLHTPGPETPELHTPGPETPDLHTPGPETPELHTPGPERQVTPAAQHQSRFFMWVVVCVLFGALAAIAVAPIVMWAVRRKYTKFRTEQEMELLPMDTGVSYRRPTDQGPAPQQGNRVGHVVQLLEGFSGRLVDSLKDVLVERNQLTLGKELGKGEFGSVYEGVFTPDGGADLKVAVKTMRVGFHTQDDLHEFLKEAEIMKNFDHDNVVRLLGVTLDVEEDSHLPVPLVILPFMKHGDLRRFLIATRYGDIPMFVPYQSLLRFMIDIAEGMDYLSSQGFLHRDLAARNCMLGDDLRVCVADFGLSKKIYSSNYYRQKVAIRVPIKWMSMESLSESIYTTKSDVWSFGVTMWEIMSRGRTPYPGVHNHELLDLLLSGHRLKLPEDCDQKLYEVMWSCWDKEPTQRPGFRDLAEALKGLLSELPALEACQEASYINQGLEAAAAAYQNPQTDPERRWENDYQPTPVGAAAAGAAAGAAAAGAAAATDEDMEDGYLKFITGSAV